MLPACSHRPTKGAARPAGGVCQPFYLYSKYTKWSPNVLQPRNFSRCYTYPLTLAARLQLSCNMEFSSYFHQKYFLSIQLQSPPQVSPHSPAHTPSGQLATSCASDSWFMDHVRVINFLLLFFFFLLLKCWSAANRRLCGLQISDPLTDLMNSRSGWILIASWPWPLTLFVKRYEITANYKYRWNSDIGVVRRCSGCRQGGEKIWGRTL